MSKQRRAFTLIELLVVIAIIAILIALLVPAVQKVREAAARTQCVNNEKQIVLAVHSYADANKHVPALYTYDLSIPAKRDYSNFLFLILPFIDQEPLYTMGTDANPVVAGGNHARWSGYAPVAATIVPAYICPADPTFGGNMDVMLGQTTGFASSNYAGNVMVFDPNNPGSLATAMPDGTSNTVVLSHRLKLCDANGPAALSGGGQTSTEWAAEPNDMYWGPHCIPGFGYQDYVAAKGSNAKFNARGLFNATIPNFHFGNIPFQTAPQTTDAGSGMCILEVTVSPHPVMIAGLGDGSVRTVDPSITKTTWVNACNPIDGTPPGGDW